MAIFHSSTFGSISGKHGSAVAVTRKDGISYIRAYSKPHNPRTEKQQAHRAKFALSSKALVPFNPIFKETIGITNGISTARSYAFKNAIVGEHPNLMIDYKKIMFSFGTLEKLHGASFAQNEDIVSIKWNFNKALNCHADDKVNIIVYNKNTNQSLHIKSIAKRSDKKANVEIDESWTDNDLHIWAYMRNEDKISDSVHVDTMEDNSPYTHPSKDNNAEKTLTVTSHASAKDEHINSMSFIMILYRLLTLLFNTILKKQQELNSINRPLHTSFIDEANSDDTNTSMRPKTRVSKDRMNLFKPLWWWHHSMFSTELVRI